jgi:hypothetical protein
MTLKKRLKEITMLQRIVVLTICALLAACASQSPPRTDPLADLVGNTRLVDSPVRVVDAAKTKSLAVIVSTSSETQIKHRLEVDAKYLEGYVKVHASRSYNAVRLQQDSVGPRRLIDAVVAELRHRFKSVTVVADLAEFQDRKHDIAVVVDIGMEYQASAGLAKYSGEFTTDVSLFVFDRQIRKIAVVKGVGTEQVEVDHTEQNVKAALLIFADQPPEDFLRPIIEAEKKSRVSALRRLNASLDQSVKN